MTYQDIHAARFLARPNRFIAQVELEGRVETVHVKNTGRCKELLLPGCTVYLEGSANPARKTKYDLVAVEKVRPGLPPLFINMDSQAPNRVFAEWMTAGLGEALGLPRPTLLRPETTWGNSRFDFYWEESGAAPMGSPCQPSEADRVGNGGARERDENCLPGHSESKRALPRRGFVEVKGCTLEENGLALFPDAPTERGVKHLRELMACRAAGFEAAVCVVVQMAGMTAFSPNDRTHPEFGAALWEAAGAGVKVLAVECAATPGSLTMTKPIPVKLYGRRA